MRHIVRLITSLLSTVLILAALSVLLNVTFEFTRMEVRFGIYLAFITSIVTASYCFLRWQEQRRTEQLEIFHHPEDDMPQEEHHQQPMNPPPPPPPPPPPLHPEEHPTHS